MAESPTAAPSPAQAIYTVFTSPNHAPVPDHLPTLIVTPAGAPQKLLYTYLHTNFNQENYLLTPSPNGDLCVAKMFPSSAITGVASSPSSSSQGHGGSSGKEKIIRCEASRALRWSIHNTGIAMPTYKLTLPSVDPSGAGEDQPLFQISKTSRTSPFWTLWYYTYSGHLVPPKRIEFGKIEKAPVDKRTGAGGGTRVVISGKSETEKAVWKTLGDGNEDMVEWIVLCAALNVLDDEIREAMKGAGTPLRAPSAATSRPPGSAPNHQLHPTGYHSNERPTPRRPASDPPDRGMINGMNGMTLQERPRTGEERSRSASNDPRQQQQPRRPDNRPQMTPDPRGPQAMPADAARTFDPRIMQQRQNSDPRLQQRQMSDPRPQQDPRQQQQRQMSDSRAPISQQRQGSDPRAPPPQQRQMSDPRAPQQNGRPMISPQQMDSRGPSPNADPRLQQRGPPAGQDPRMVDPRAQQQGTEDPRRDPRMQQPDPRQMQQDPRQLQDPRIQEPRVRGDSRGPSPDMRSGPRPLPDSLRSGNSSPQVQQQPPPRGASSLSASTSSALPYESGPSGPTFAPRPGPGQAQSAPIRPRIGSNNAAPPPQQQQRSPVGQAPPSPGRQRVEGNYVPSQQARSPRDGNFPPGQQQPAPQNPANFMRPRIGANGPSPSLAEMRRPPGTQLQDVPLSRQV